MSLRSGPNSFTPPAARRVQARTGRASEPLAGSHRSVHVTLFDVDRPVLPVRDAQRGRRRRCAPHGGARDERCDENEERRGCAHALRVLSRPVPPASGRRIAAVVACVLAVAILLPVGARAVSSRWHDDSLWANSLRSLGGLEVPFDFAIFLKAADDVRSGESPYVDPETVSEDAAPPYVYPPLLAIVLIPATALPDESPARRRSGCSYRSCSSHAWSERCSCSTSATGAATR